MTTASGGNGVGDRVRTDQLDVAGHSFGGEFAQDYLAHHPERCLGSILLCTLVPADPSNFEDLLERALARAGEAGYDEALAAFPRKPTTTDEEATQLIGDILATIDVPTVVVAGSDDFVCSPPKNLRIHHAIAGSRFVLAENAGHFPWFENRDQFWSGLNSALDSPPT